MSTMVDPIVLKLKYPVKYIAISLTIDSDKSGCKCNKCKDHFPYAVSNQENGIFICWACKNGA